MTELFVRLQAFAQSHERGAAMAEYGLLLSFIALVVIAILTTFGSTLRDFFDGAAAEFVVPGTP